MQKASLPFNSPIWAIYFESAHNTFKVIKSQNLVSLKLYSVAINFFFLCAFTNVSWTAFCQALRILPAPTSCFIPFATCPVQMTA